MSLGLVFLKTLVTVAHQRIFTLSLLPPNVKPSLPVSFFSVRSVFGMVSGMFVYYSLNLPSMLFWSPTSCFSFVSASLLDSGTSYLLTTPTSSYAGVVPLPAEPPSSSHITVGCIFKKRILNHLPALETSIGSLSPPLQYVQLDCSWPGIPMLPAPAPPDLVGLLSTLPSPPRNPLSLPSPPFNPML